MATNCTEKITTDNLNDCADKPIKGISNSKAVLINWDDIDWTATTIGTDGVITALTLKSGTTGYDFEWYKDLGSMASNFNVVTDGIDGFTHTFNGRMMVPTAEASERMAELKGGTFIVVAETKYKGESNDDAFKVLGIGNGMKLSAGDWSTAENSGSIVFSLATEADCYEDRPYNVLLKTDYATTLTDFGNKFCGSII